MNIKQIPYAPLRSLVLNIPNMSCEMKRNHNNKAER